MIRKSQGQYVTIAKNHTNVILERMGLLSCGDMSESVRTIRIIKTMTRINQQLLIIIKKTAVEGENDTKEIEVHQFSIKKISHYNNMIIW